jgi:magnesium chelatase subunit H
MTWSTRAICCSPAVAAAAAELSAAAATAGAGNAIAPVAPAPRRIVLISGFESFNVKLYIKAATSLAKRFPAGPYLSAFSQPNVKVFVPEPTGVSQSH